MEYVIVFIVFLLAMTGFVLSLHFSKYKQGESGCCGGDHCDSESSGGCYSEKVKFVEKYNTDS